MTVALKQSRAAAVVVVLTRLLEAASVAKKLRHLRPLEDRLEGEMARAFLAQGRAVVRDFSRFRFHFRQELREDAARPQPAPSGVPPTDAEWEALFRNLPESIREMFAGPAMEASEQALLLGGNDTAAELRRARLPISVNFDLKNPRAVRYLEQEAAKLVTRVDDTTRSRLASLVTNGMDEGWSYGKVAQAITREYREMAVGKPQQHIDSRAHLIAVTELGNAYEHGSQAVALDMAELLPMEKSWLTVGDDRVSPGCVANASAGWIGAKDLFPSGHERPLRFPGCRCSALWQMVPGGKAQPTVRTAMQAVLDQASQDKTGYSKELRKLADSGAFTVAQIEEMRGIALEHKAAIRGLSGDPDTDLITSNRKLSRNELPDLVREYMAQVRGSGSVSFDNLDLDDAIQFLRELPKDSHRQGAAVFGKELWDSIQAPDWKTRTHKERFVGSEAFWEKTMRLQGNHVLGIRGDEAKVEHLTLPISVHDNFGQYREFPQFMDPKAPKRFEAKQWDAETKAYYADQVGKTTQYTDAWRERPDELIALSKEIRTLRSKLENPTRAWGSDGGRSEIARLFDLEGKRAADFGIQPGGPVAMPPAPVPRPPAVSAAEDFERRRDVFVSEWVNGSRARLSVAMKEAARDVFESQAIAYSRRDYRFETHELDAARKTVADLWDQTQVWAQSQGITTIRLYRGVKSDYATESVLESWTTDQKIAKKFDGYDVLVKDVPVENLLFGSEVPGWKNGRFGEQREFIVINGRAVQQGDSFEPDSEPQADDDSGGDVPF